MRKRNVNLDLIKSIACICVVGLHTVSMNNYTLYYLCDCGVPLFFMVNGYLLLSREQADYRYVFHKIAHILKIVLCWNFLIAIPVLIFRQKMINPFRLAFNSLLQKGYLWHFWFFGSLIIIYLFLPVFHRMFLKKAFTSGCLSCFHGNMFLHECAFHNKGISTQYVYPSAAALWTWVFYFLAGGLFAVESQKIQQFPISIHGILLLFFTLFSNIAEKKVGLYLVHSRLAEYFYDNLFSIVWYCLLFTFLLRIPIKASYGVWISRFSRLTMGIFIIHPILLFALNTRITPVGTISVLSFWLGLTLLSLLIGYVMDKIPVVRELIRL